MLRIIWTDGLSRFFRFQCVRRRVDLIHMAHWPERIGAAYQQFIAGRLSQYPNVVLTGFLKTENFYEMSKE